MVRWGPVPNLARTTLTGTGSVKDGSGSLAGWYVSAAVAAGAITLSDSTGTVLVVPTCAAGSAVTGLYIGFAGHLTATFAGTGTVVFLTA
jgi:hypothetical protein